MKMNLRELIDAVCEEGYQKELLPLYPNEYLEKYSEEAERSALRVANRQHYRAP